jgi:3-(methylthio)propanoyl-CoA dehydrogenase
MANFFTDNEDLAYYLDRGIDWAPLVAFTELGFKRADGHKDTAEALSFYKDIAERIGELAAEEIAPHALEIDREGVRYENGEAVFPPRLKKVFETIKGLGLHGLTLPRELGGENLPMLMYFMNCEVLARAEVSVMAHHGFYGGIAMAMLVFSILEGSTDFNAQTGEITKTRWRREIDEIVAGGAWGCMDITEPDAGSDMAALRTVGEQLPDGTWVVSGQKIFITSGHGKYHFVIARTEKPSASTDDPMDGLKGLSMFMVPAFDETGKRTVSLDRLEEKMGHHGSVTAALTFERAPAQLVGNRGDGFKHMLTLMNNARLAVGFESIGVAEAALRMARAYAAGRPSMGKTVDKHEMIADYLDEMETDILGLRALAMYAAFHEELGIKQQMAVRFATPDLDAKRLERDAKEHKSAARKVTPLLKYLASEKAVEIARRAVQIHGGNGYMKEYGAEKLLRDAMVMPIYEGTSQIQSLMAMKDTLGAIIKNPQGFVTRVAQARWRGLSARDPLERRVAKLQSLSLAAQQHLITRTAADKLKALSGTPITKWPTAFLKNWNPKRDFAFAMLHAERLTRLLADEAIVEVLLAQVRRHPERRPILERYLDRAEPRCRFLLDEITTTGQRILDKLVTPAADTAATGSE